MGFKPGEGGRRPGAKNRRTMLVEEVAARFDIDPFEILMMVAAGDWKGLGYDSPTRTSFAASGIEFEEPVIKLSDRIAAAKEAAKYLYAQKRAVELSAPDESGFNVIITDYTTKVGLP